MVSVHPSREQRPNSHPSATASSTLPSPLPPNYDCHQAQSYAFLHPLALNRPGFAGGEEHDNVGHIRSSPDVKAWLAKHPRFHCHFMPISAPWLNLVERFFAGITRKRIRRGIFKSVAEIEVVIDHTLAQHNGAPKPFVWTKSAAAALKKNAAPSTSSKLAIHGTKRWTQNTSEVVPINGCLLWHDA